MSIIALTCGDIVTHCRDGGPDMAFIFATDGNPLRMDLNFSRILSPDAVVTRTSTVLTVDVDGFRYKFTGEGLAYNGLGIPTQGTLTALEFSQNDVVLYSRAGGFGISAAVIYDLAANDSGLLLSLQAGNDNVYGGDLRDRIIDPSGHNNLYGGAGSDTIIAGDGNDHIYGQSASGGADDADDIDAGAGSDYVQGNAGNDMIHGGAGSDRIQGGADDDFLYGDAGGDTINGNRGSDRVYGGDGNDSLRGGQGDDTLYGDDGSDIVSGDMGTDLLYGGLGSDIFVFTAGSAVPGSGIAPNSFDAVEDFLPGIDQLSIGFLPSAILTAELVRSEGVHFLWEDAVASAQRAMDAHPGDHEVVALQYLTRVMLLWSEGGGSTVDSLITVSYGSFTPHVIPDNFFLYDFV